MEKNENGADGCSAVVWIVVGGVGECVLYHYALCGPQDEEVVV